MDENTDITVNQKPLRLRKKRFYILILVLVIIVVIGYITYRWYNSHNILEANRFWMTTFFQDVNGYRSTNLTYCPVLTNFSEVRFSTMVHNFSISHYGLYNDSNKFFVKKLNVTYKIYLGEEVFFPQTYENSTTPANFIGQIQKLAPDHWMGLINSTYIHYGYFIGSGPSVLSSSSCGPAEVTTPRVNSLQSNVPGCTTKVINNTDWLVIELSSECP